MTLQERFNSLFEYHAEGFLTWKIEKRGVPVGSIVGKSYNSGFVQFNHDDKTYHVHRVIYQMFHGEIEKGLFVDHINRNKQDNRLENLRVATRTENNRNKNPYRNSVSSYKGVDFYKRLNVWRARIKVNKNLIDLGGFSSETDAAVAYNEAAKRYFGEFAVLNVIQVDTSGAAQ